MSLDDFYTQKIHAPNLHLALNGGDEFCHQLDFWTRTELLALARGLGLTAGARLLDLGCGLGGPACLWARELDLRVLGLDVVEAHVAKARALAEAQGLGDSVEFAQFDLERDAFPQVGASAALCVDCLVHVADVEGMLTRLAQTLPPTAPLAFVFEVVSPDAPVALVRRREEIGRVHCRSRDWYRARFDSTGYEILDDWLDTARRGRFARAALDWMEHTGDQGGSANMDAILKLCDLGVAASNTLSVRRR